MAYEYLDNLSLEEADKAKLRSLGARTAASLLSRIEYSPESRQHFATFLGGEDRLAKIEIALRTMVGPSDTRSLSAPKPSLGAIDPAQAPPSSDPNMEQRKNELVEEIKRRRSLGDEEGANQRAEEYKSLLKFQ